MVTLKPLPDAYGPPFENAPFFEGCLPVEELAARGPLTLAYGPMKPVGLCDPRTGRRPFAVVQLRSEDRAGQMWNLVGFQTRLKIPAQREILRMIPGLDEPTKWWIKAPLDILKKIDEIAHG